AELTALLTPALFAPRQLERRDPRNPARLIRLRARILTLPVMVALVVSLVWRRLGSIAEVQRVLVQDGLLWVSPLQVSEQAIAKRLDTLPASALAAAFADVSARLQAQPPPHLPWLRAIALKSVSKHQLFEIGLIPARFEAFVLNADGGR